jgi:TRAP-type C4-dicarboxylate transport system permease small subunit
MNDGYKETFLELISGLRRFFEVFGTGLLGIIIGYLLANIIDRYL